MLVAATLDRRRNSHGLAVFRDRAAGDIDAGRAQLLHDGVVGQDLARVFGLDQLLDMVANGFGGMRLATVGGCNRGGEKIFQFEYPAVGRHVFVGGDARDRGFMHADGVRHGLEIERAQMANTVGKEGVLLAHDFGGDFQDRLGALIERSDKPGGGLQRFGEIGFCLLARGGLRDIGVIGLVHQNLRQRVGVEVHNESAIRAGTHENIGHDRLHVGGPKSQSGLGVEIADFRDHLGQVFLADTADLAQGGEFALGEQIEPSNQRGHGGIVAVAFFELDGEAFGEVARTHARRIEPLQDGKYRLDLG